MTDKPAVMQGCYVGMKFMPGYKVARLSIDIPIEASNSFLQMFGAPDAANPVHVAIARLTNDQGRKAPLEDGEVEAQAEKIIKSSSSAHPKPVIQPESPRKPFRELPRSQQAAIKCQDPEFQNWIIGKFDMLGMGVTPERADAVLKRILQIESKKLLDTTVSGLEWDKLLTDFDYRGRIS